MKVADLEERAKRRHRSKLSSRDKREVKLSGEQFAFSSVMESRGTQVLIAGTSREAIRTVEFTPDVAICLLDNMMPEMDGYKTMQVIRQKEAFRRLPIIAFMAKAMNREKCSKLARLSIWRNRSRPIRCF